jgi:hypothetical protein
MKKNSTVESQEKTEGKGAFYHAGEVIGSIGFHIVDGKDKVIGAIKNKLGKKQPSESKAKKDSKKKLPRKTGKPVAGTVKKRAKKVNPAKVASGKAGKVKNPAKSTKEKE